MTCSEVNLTTIVINECFLMKNNNSRSLCDDWIKIWSLRSHFKLNLEVFITNPITELKNLSNHRVVIRKNPLQITSDHFRMTTLWFDEFFNAHSYLILNITNFWLLNLEFANLWSHEVNSSQITNLGKLRYTYEGSK